MKNESLSDKINYEIRCAANKGTYFGFIHENDVKEKIQNAERRLKEELCEQPMMDCGSDECGTCNNCKKIDKTFKEEFGDKLI